jgi:DNA-binding beta-propeller fold protein YncE
MRGSFAIAAGLILGTVGVALARQTPGAAPYRVLKSATVGGEGSWDYIYADVAARRLYIPRHPSSADLAKPGPQAIPTRLKVYDLDTLDPAGEIEGIGGHGVAVDPATGHGFASSKPVSMFDTRTMKIVKSIDVGAAEPDGIVFDRFNQRVYVFSHPTKDATVIDAKDGTVLGVIDLGGVPEQGVPDGKGTLYVVMQDTPGSVTVVDVKTMKATAHYPLGDQGRCNGLALDVANRVLFAACATSGNPLPAQPQPMMVILRATDGQVITTLPLAGASDGAVFNPATREAFSTHSNGTLTIVKETSPTRFEVEQDLQTMDGARTLAFDSKTGHIVTMSDRRGPPPPTPPGGRPARGPAVPGSFTLLMIGK